MNRPAEPAVLRSWRHVRAELGLAAPASLPFTQEGTTFVMAQELSWLDLQHFAVGRWDGSMSIFRFSDSPTEGPLITKAINTPSAEGVQMICLIAPSCMVSSNDESSCLVWTSRSGGWTDVVVGQTLSFNPALGVANSAASYVTPSSSVLYLAVGHANGYVTLWQGASDGSGLATIATIDVRSNHPLNPWGLQNVRGLATIFWTDSEGYLVSGSENGNLCVIRAPDGAVLSTTPYNPQAQRGINSIATLGQNLLVANCMVGSTDRNLWYYWIDSASWAVELRDAAKLQIDPTAAQVFNFDVIWAYYSGGLCWLSATEEGYLWLGTVDQNATLVVLGNQQVTSRLGAALGICWNGNLAVAAYDLYEFNTTPSVANPHASGLPERLAWPTSR